MWQDFCHYFFIQFLLFYFRSTRKKLLIYFHVLNKKNLKTKEIKRICKYDSKFYLDKNTFLKNIIANSTKNTEAMFVAYCIIMTMSNILIEEITETYTYYILVYNSLYILHLKSTCIKKFLNRITTCLFWYHVFWPLQSFANIFLGHNWFFNLMKILRAYINFLWCVWLHKFWF